MSTAIQGFGQQVPPATSYSQSLSIDAQEPAGGPKPPPSSVQAAFSDSRLTTDTFTPSQAASVLLSALPSAAPPKVSTPPATQNASAATPAPGTAQVSSETVTTQAQNPVTAVVAQNRSDASNAVKQFEESQGPPPFTLSNALPDPNKINSKPLYAQPLNAFQIRQFSDLLKTLRSITSSVLPNFSFSA